MEITSRSTKLMTGLLCLALLLPSTITFGQETIRDYYMEGKFAAKADYSGGVAVVGGLVSGFALGLIGWGLGYLIVANSDPNIPSHYTANMDATQKMQFETGYSEYVMKTKKSKFNMGGGIGTLGAVIYTVSVTSE